MPVYGIGTWQMGGDKKRNPVNDDDADVRAIRTAIDMGVTHIDTAELYAEGYAEKIVARAIKGYERSKLVLVSKVMPAHCSYDGILRACEQSLKRLETDYLDLYLMHSLSPEFPLSESIRALDRLVDEGIIKHIGVANFGKEYLAEAQARACHKIVCDQVHYNCAFREPERAGLLEFCQKNDIFLMAWRPYRDILRVVPEMLLTLCKKYNKTPVQIALNWLISQDNVITLSKTRDGEHLEENLGALGWEMSKEDVEYIRSSFPNQQERSDAVPLNVPLPSYSPPSAH